ncbi:zinc finger protein [Trypanosoma melophagium]|uniref:zinc finger protein n=1 Tax=Trypanosoma melophagium TaxID=715481 RepID=UPI003519DAC3|nr:zinc finger protein [Trypanosoma melophagium]
MILFGQLVCAGCRKILSYPLGAISCRCRNCNTVNAAQNIHLHCGCCGQSILVPLNTLRFLCPCCATVTDIPQSLLPRVEEPVDIGAAGEKGANTIYVTYPIRRSRKKSKPRKTTAAPSHTSSSLSQLTKTVLVEEGMAGKANVLAGGVRREARENVGGTVEEMEEIRAKHHVEEGDEEEEEEDRGHMMGTLMVVGTQIL